MSFIPVTLAALQGQLQNDAHQLLSFIDWINDRNSAYGQAGLSGSYMTSLGISPADQNNIFALLADFGRINAYLQGNPQNVAAIVRFDVNNIIGVS
jgi:hypothetical protein